MGKLKEIVKKTPVLLYLYRALRNRYTLYQLNQLKKKTTEQVFNKIYKTKAWGGRNSVSGPGSDDHQTGIIIKELQVVFNELSISTMLDIPCGDFHWMNNLNFDLSNIDYTGADIVKDLISDNNEKYGRDNVRFLNLNMIKDKLPEVALVFCRDCLVHFSFADIFLSLENVCDSQSEFFLTTTFIGRKENHDIATGQWRPLNLELAPLLLPRPIRIINEGCTEGHGAYEDKALGLWRVANIRESLTLKRHPNVKNKSNYSV